MSVPTVFVHADGRIEHRDMLTAPPSWRFPVQSPLRASVFSPDELFNMEPAKTLDYAACGQMFDGRPVYCANGWDVKEAAMRSERTRFELAERADSVDIITSELRLALQSLVFRTYPHESFSVAILDVGVGLERRPTNRNTAAFVARILVAVRKEKLK